MGFVLQIKGPVCNSILKEMFLFFLLVARGGRVEGLAWADPGARTPIGASGNCKCIHIYYNIMLIIVNEWLLVIDIGTTQCNEKQW